MIFSWKYIRKQVFLAKCGGGNNNNDWQILCRATPNVFIVQEGAAHLCIFVEQCRAIKRSVGDRTWSSFRLKWLFCNDCNPRLFNPLIRLFVVTPLCGDKLLLPAAMVLLLMIVPLAPPIDPKLVSIFYPLSRSQISIAVIYSLTHKHSWRRSFIPAFQH